MNIIEAQKKRKKPGVTLIEPYFPIRKLKKPQPPKKWIKVPKKN